ncbi:hypothetical protein Hanom_Chr11g01029731 [Helianthus anomalus]
MGARKDLSVSFSRLTQEESVDQCPSGSIPLYCRHFEFSNFRHPFSTFVVNVLEYYRVSFGQIHPKGMPRVLHFEVLCRASGYDPSLLLFRRFFHLAKNGDWFTFETSKVDTCLISSMLTTLGAWKDRFIWVSESIIPFKMVWRHPDAVLNEPGPSESDLNDCFLKAMRQCPSRVRAFPEHLLVFHDTVDVVFTDAQAAEGDDVVGRGSEHRFEYVGYVSVQYVKGFTKTAAPKALTHRSAHRMLKSTSQSTSSDPVELSDDIEVSESQGPDAEKEKNLVVLGAISEMEGDTMLSRLMLSSCNLSALVAEGVTRFCKGMQDYEEFSKKKEKMKASMATLKKDIDGFSKKEEAWVKKAGELTRRHEIEINDLKKSFEADKLKLKADREALDVQKKTLIEEKEGLEDFVVVTYLLHSTEFNFALGEVYTKLLNYGKHLGMFAGLKLHVSG